MDLRPVNEKKKGDTPTKNPAPKKSKTNKGELPVFKEIDYEYELNEPVKLSADGWKQNDKLKKESYRVTSVYLAQLGDMSCWMMTLNEEDDENICNPYLANHFEPVNRRVNEGT